MSDASPAPSLRFAFAFVGVHLGLLAAALMLSPMAPASAGAAIRITLPALCVLLIGQVLVLSRTRLWETIGMRRSGSLGWIIAIPLMLLSVSIALRGGFTNLAGIDAEIWVLFLSALVLVAITEEITFRGVLFSALRARMDRNRVLVYSSLMFGFAHAVAAVHSADIAQISLQVFGASLFGLLIGIVRINGGALAPCIAIHFVWNFAVLSGKHTSQMVDPAYQTAAGAVMILALASAVAVGVRYRRHPQVLAAGT